ncbi:MAG: hypothetical protein HKN41_03350 [Ilumatobacter sp.]|nr:hypothetical protein [Ilumatobacter sp.]
MFRKKATSDPTPADLFRAPIITENLIIRSSMRTDANALEATMDLARLAGGERTPDGARRFGSGLADVPVWSATRAVCEKGSLNVLGGVVINEVEDTPTETWRIGWWLAPQMQHHAVEVVSHVDARLRAMGAHTVVIHVRTDDQLGQQVAATVGFQPLDTLKHTTAEGTPLEFWRYVKAA